MEELKKTREEIDKIDEKIEKLLEERARVVKIIGKIKREANLAKTDNERENEIMKKLDSQYLKNIFKAIIKESKKLQ